MGQQFFRLLVWVLCLSCWTALAWSAAPAWQGLTQAQQAILAPVASKWAGMSDLQRRRLLAVAAQYPQLKPQAQQRFQKRLTTWSSLTPAQRDLARRNYKKLRQLPPKKQLAVKQQWLQSHPKIPPVTPVKPDKARSLPP